MRSSQDQVLWNTFGIFTATNTLLLIALFQTGHLPLDSMVGLVVSGFGIVMSLAGILVQFRALGHIQRHEQLIKRLDEQLVKDPKDASLSLYYKEDFGGLMCYPRARDVMRVSGAIFLIAWVVIFLYLLR